MHSAWRYVKQLDIFSLCIPTPDTSNQPAIASGLPNTGYPLEPNQSQDLITTTDQVEDGLRIGDRVTHVKLCPGVTGTILRFEDIGVCRWAIAGFPLQTLQGRIKEYPCNLNSLIKEE